MSSNLKQTMISLFVYLKKQSNWFIFVFILSGCAFFNNSEVVLNEREVIFEKANVLLQAEQYAKAEPLFLSLTAEPAAKLDPIYDLSLWNISLIYDKFALPEKAILALDLLRERKSTYILEFTVNAALMKNYFLVGNKLVALKYKKLLDDENPKTSISADILYSNLRQTLNLNYDQLVLQELDYIGEIQKYLLFVMEQNESSTNQQATENLISIYQQSYARTEKDSLKNDFKKEILISLLDKLRKFNLYKLNDLNINLKTVSKFSIFAEKLEKQITDRLHQ